MLKENQSFRKHTTWEDPSKGGISLYEENPIGIYALQCDGSVEESRTGTGGKDRYIHSDGGHHGSGRSGGLGRKVYEALEAALKERGIRNLYACIGYPSKEDEYLTKNSAQFHRHLGFEQVGEFHNCGYKFGRWYHMIWMEKIIGEHGNISPPPRTGCYKDHNKSLS
ncbi:MAG TPA: GNAT family N-acetyltransferase [Candidatus Dorea gallistercoris]|uniref:GNAT family N-acetyltransferase n=1 Tax=Candidatus Dorea gallistercoris TaxID=2838542 RepID=A0A9D1R8N6_9FIRM|nr:GNAT family N-acetyltransferase [Candidatus Dorea gallistercoris]